MPIVETSDPITEAVIRLDWVRGNFDSPELRKAADALDRYLRLATMIEKDINLPNLRPSPGTAVDDFATAVAQATSGKGEGNKKPPYQTNVFKCLSDYDQCMKRRPQTLSLCVALVIICITKQLVPLAPKG